MTVVVSKMILVEQKAPETPRPWRFLEVYNSIDGPRTRVCDGTWETAEAALEEMQKRVSDA